MEGHCVGSGFVTAHLGLDNLCWVYDNNHITIEGKHSHCLHGGRGHPVPRLWMECSPGW